MREDKTELQLEAIEKETRGFECPNCHVHLQFRVRLNVVGVQQTPTGEEAAARDGRPFEGKTTPARAIEEEQLLADLESSGLLAAFSDALDKAVVPSKPSDTPSYMLSWLNLATKVKLSPPMVSKLYRLYPSSRIEVFAAQYIAAVVVEGRVRAFYPYSLLKGQSVDKLTPSGMEITKTKDRMTTEIWHRSKFGYVTGRGAYFSEMKKHSKGAFANTGI